MAQECDHIWDSATLLTPFRYSLDGSKPATLLCKNCQNANSEITLSDAVQIQTLKFLKTIDQKNKVLNNALSFITIVISIFALFFA